MLESRDIFNWEIISGDTSLGPEALEAVAFLFSLHPNAWLESRLVSEILTTLFTLQMFAVPPLHTGSQAFVIDGLLTAGT